MVSSDTHSTRECLLSHIMHAFMFMHDAIQGCCRYAGHLCSPHLELHPTSMRCCHRHSICDQDPHRGESLEYLSLIIIDGATRKTCSRRTQRLPPIIGSTRKRFPTGLFRTSGKHCSHLHMGSRISACLVYSTPQLSDVMPCTSDLFALFRVESDLLSVYISRSCKLHLDLNEFSNAIIIIPFLHVCN